MALGRNAGKIAIRAGLCCLMMLSASAAQADAVDDAWSLMDKGRVHAAESLLAQALISDPSSYRAWFALGVARARMHHRDAAIRAFREVIRLRPDLAEAHNNIAVIYFAEGKLEEARKELDLALSLDPGYSVALENRADLHLREAISDFDQAIRHAPAEERARLMARREALASMIEGGRGRVRLNSGAAKDASARQQRVDRRFDTPEHLLQTWRKAWERKDIDGFFACYGEAFQPPARFRSVEEWKRYKRRVIANKRFIRVHVRHVVMGRQDADRVKVGFRQEYVSDLFSDRVDKMLLMQRTPQGWRIIREEVYR